MTKLKVSCFISDFKIASIKREEGTATVLLEEKNPPFRDCQEQQEIMPRGSSEEQLINQTEIFPICCTETEEVRERSNHILTILKTEKQNETDIKKHRT